MVEESPEQQRVATAREEILARVRMAVSSKRSERESEYAYIPRQYNRASSMDDASTLALFIERVRDYGAEVFECGEPYVSAAVASALTERQLRKLLIGREFPVAWVPQGFNFYTDNSFNYEAVDSFKGVVTPCALAIAQTGSIILRHWDDEPRRAVTLIPDYHLCIVFAQQIVGTVPEAIEQMGAMGNVPLTMVSGPSATSDIEMTRIKGVHGPRTLDVIVVR